MNDELARLSFQVGYALSHSDNIPQVRGGTIGSRTCVILGGSPQDCAEWLGLLENEELTCHVVHGVFFVNHMCGLMVYRNE